MGTHHSRTWPEHPHKQHHKRRAAPSAEFSVDRTRHLMSFLTMLGPSPDWNVGLSGEDLCTKDCGWVQRLVADLIPWDAGTDSGVTYEQCFSSLWYADISSSPLHQHVWKLGKSGSLELKCGTVDQGQTSQLWSHLSKFHRSRIDVLDSDSTLQT
ncbi:hypothetical protein ILYODFUR_031520 [Ilyodon furcidens]|uniref:Spondin domain-containing protein n=1 Tax=Ilyodon furcidens TaxID=33524 RepID=A0ABV0UKW3_9TELE